MSSRGMKWSAPGTYYFVVPAGVSVIWIAEMIGAGGGGGGANAFLTTAAGGGGAGELCQGLQILVTPGDTIVVIVGAGGVGGRAGNAGGDAGYSGSGANGGDTSFGWVVCQGGRGGPASDRFVGGTYEGWGLGGKGGGVGGDDPSLRSNGLAGRPGSAEQKCFFGGAGGGSTNGNLNPSQAYGGGAGPNPGGVPGTPVVGYYFFEPGAGGASTIFGLGGNGGNGQVGGNGTDATGAGAGGGGGGSAQHEFKNTGGTGGKGGDGYLSIQWEEE